MRRTCLNQVLELARRDERVVFVGSDLGPGTLDAFKRELPERFFMEGVAEQNVIGMAAGLAMAGFIPYVNTIATFLTRRCLEQVAMDLCLHNLPVRLIGNGGGLVYAPLGPTHLAIEDLALMRALPNMSVVAPADAGEMTRMMPHTLDLEGPLYIRLGKGGDPVVTPPEAPFAFGRGEWLRPLAAGGVALLSTGVMSGRCLDAAALLAQRGISAGVLHLPTVKPLDGERIRAAAAACRLLVTVEEHVATGGFGSGVADLLLAAGGPWPRILRLALPDAFTTRYGSQDALLAFYDLHPEGIAERVAAALG